MGLHTYLRIPLPRLTEVKEIHLSTAIRSFALSIAGVFVPLYLMDLGLSLNKVILYMVAFFIISTIATLFVGKLISNVGIKKTALIGTAGTAIYLLLLHFMKAIPALLYVAAIIGALGFTLYWIPLNAHFAKNTKKKKSGKDIGNWIAISRIAGSLGPIAGGLLILYTGYNFVFIASLFVLLLATIPLFMTSEHKSSLDYKIKDLFVHKNLHFFNDFFLQGTMAIVAAIVFPVYIYLITQNYGTTGLFTAAIGFSVALVSFFVGGKGKRLAKNMLMLVGAPVGATAWLAMIFIPEAYIPVLTFFIGGSYVLIAIPLFSYFVDSIKTARAEHMIFREIALNVGRIVALSIFVLVPVGTKFTVGFAMAAVSCAYFAVSKL